jgi:hypothetical protein
MPSATQLKKAELAVEDRADLLASDSETGERYCESHDIATLPFVTADSATAGINYSLGMKYLIFKRVANPSRSEPQASTGLRNQRPYHATVRKAQFPVRSYSEIANGPLGFGFKIFR